MEDIGNEGREFTTREMAKISKMLKDEIPTKVLEQMVELSRQARDNSYSPYSKFRVGCCLLTETGDFILGKNKFIKARMWKICHMDSLFALKELLYVIQLLEAKEIWLQLLLRLIWNFMFHHAELAGRLYMNLV
jgi:hypothetical protein